MFSSFAATAAPGIGPASVETPITTTAAKANNVFFSAISRNLPFPARGLAAHAVSSRDLRRATEPQYRSTLDCQRLRLDSRESRTKVDLARGEIPARVCPATGAKSPID